MRTLGPKIRFHVAAADKQAIARSEQAKRAAELKYRFKPDSLYDELTGELFSGMRRFADEHRLCVAKRGNKERNEAIHAALAKADSAFESRFGFKRKGQWTVEVSDPIRRVCLQAADYFLWAVQRFFETRFYPATKSPVMDKATGAAIREGRYLNLVWPQITEIHDLHFGSDHGTRWSQAKPLTISFAKNKEATDAGSLRFSRRGAEFCPWRTERRRVKPQSQVEFNRCSPEARCALTEEVANSHDFVAAEDSSGHLLIG